MYITLVMLNFKEGVRLKNSNLSQLLESYLVVQQHHCQMKEFLTVLLMSLVMGTVYFMYFQSHYCVNFSALAII
uniref:Uncharacterized protein n=1 Tax=Amphimedon queenslandica TaxID=400682 RepID=A0A1X7V7U3_AMPQE